MHSRQTHCTAWSRVLLLRPTWLRDGTRWVSALALALTMAPSVWAKELILCQAPGHRDVTISLQDRQVFHRQLDCIAGDFIMDLTPCAPDGGYGLSAPTGSAALIAVINRWQDYADHLGGVVSHYITSTEMYFSGGSTSPSSGYHENWSFTVSRLTGAGELIKEGKPTASYNCEKVSRRF